jgi:Trk-type K+ transport system membrane component
MTPAVTLFAALTITLTTLVALYAASVRHVVKNESPFPRLALVPLITPVHTWRLGARALTIATVSCATLYVVLWIAASTRGLS